MTWNQDKDDFDAVQAFDFTSLEAGVALEMYFNAARDRLYVTTGVPGQPHIFDTSGDAIKPKRLKSLPTGEGAHQVAITKDEHYAFVQNALLNLPDLSDGSITVIDLEREAVVANITTLRGMGLNPNSIVLLPEWSSLAGHRCHGSLSATHGSRSGATRAAPPLGRRHRCPGPGVRATSAP